MDLRDLEYFLAVVEAKSVTLAARRVHAAQPTLSHALARLENELGERLLERKARAPLRLTDAGEVVAARARQAVSAVTASSGARTRRQVRLSATVSADAHPRCDSAGPRGDLRHLRARGAARDRDL